MTNSNFSYCNRPLNERPASPTNMVASNLTPTSVLLSWTPGIGGAPVAYYNVWQAASPGYWAGQTDGNTPWLALYNLNPNTNYGFQAFAVGYDGQYSLDPAGIYFVTPPLYYRQPFYPPRPGCYPPPPYSCPPRPNCGTHKKSGW